MKRLSIILFIFASIGVNAQQKLSELPVATSVGDADKFLITQGGSSKSAAYSIFKYNSTSAANQISDSLDYYTTLDSLSYYMLSTQIRTELNDTANNIRSDISDSLISFVPAAAGVTGNIQVNDDGALGFDPNFTWNDTTLDLSFGDNTFIGKDVAVNITTGTKNTFLGYNSGNLNTTGKENIFIGNGSGGNNLTGSNNTFIGFQTGTSQTSGSNNTYLGWNAGGLGNKTGCVMIGYQGGYNETGSNKLYIENSNADKDNALIYGEFDNNKLVFNVDTATTAGHHKIDSTLEVECSQIVINKLYAHAYLPEDSTGVTSTTTVDTYNFVVGNFINDMLRNMDFDADTLQVNRPQIDSIYIKVNYTVAVSSTKNSYIKFGFSNNGGVWSGSTKGVSLDLGETKSVTHSFNKWVYDNEDIKFMVKSSALNTDISITEANLELIELYTSDNYNK